MTHARQHRSLFFFQMRLRPGARFLCYSRDFDTYSIQILFFSASRGAPGLCCFGRNKLRMLLVFLEMLQEYHTGHIRTVNLNLTDDAFRRTERRLGGGRAKTERLYVAARTTRLISQPRSRTNRKQRASRPPISLPPPSLSASASVCPFSPVPIRVPLPGLDGADSARPGVFSRL